MLLDLVNDIINGEAKLNNQEKYYTISVIRCSQHAVYHNMHHEAHLIMDDWTQLKGKHSKRVISFSYFS